VFLDSDSGYAVAADEDMVRWWTLPSRYTAPLQLSRPRRHGELTRLDADVAALVDAAEQAITERRFTEAHELLTRARVTRGYERAPHVLTAWRSLADVCRVLECGQAGRWVSSPVSRYRPARSTWRRTVRGSCPAAKLSGHGTRTPDAACGNGT